MTPATPCAVCAANAVIKRSAFFATRGIDWPTVQVNRLTVHRTCVGEMRSVERVADQAVCDGEVLRWRSNGSCVPDDLMALALALGTTVTAAQVEATRVAREAEIKQALADYRARQPKTPSEEERAQARAAFGPGAEVVDAISGRRFTT